ncbi:unnamed protein product [Schistosoma rodhaini]|uniref:Uncharacterized protein n=1 Tax=Schistosoma rodhaini TaxID=6188 RepID=A0AA85GIG5_9TREM|nr:unnamed protein product [Schistosoma rodhaini]
MAKNQTLVMELENLLPSTETTLLFQNISIDDMDTLICDISTGKTRLLIPYDRKQDIFEKLHNISHLANKRACEKYEAALRALNEEQQQKSARYLEAAQNAKESAHAATQRAACASSEVAQLRIELERMTQAYKKEQTKCAATVNKLTEVMSGKNPDTLELMWLASFQQQEQEAGGRTVSPFSLGSNSARNKVANLKGLGQVMTHTMHIASI